MAIRSAGIGGWKRALAALLIVVPGLYLLALALFYVFQARLIYPGWWMTTPILQIDLKGYRDIPFTTADGLRGRLLYHPPARGRPVILFFHGNGDNLTGSAAAVKSYVARGYGAVLPEYRGFGDVPGTPSERSLYSDAYTVTHWMTKNGIPANRTVIMGYSLGTGVAAELALEVKPRALVLVAPYASISNVAAGYTSLVPARWLINQRFETWRKIGRIDCPILLVHGADDRTVPPNNSLILKSAQPAADRIIFPGMGHGVVMMDAPQARIVAWLKEHGS